MMMGAGVEFTSADPARIERAAGRRRGHRALVRAVAARHVHCGGSPDVLTRGGGKAEEEYNTLKEDEEEYNT